MCLTKACGPFHRRRHVPISVARKPDGIGITLHMRPLASLGSRTHIGDTFGDTRQEKDHGHGPPPALYAKLFEVYEPISDALN
jgi:hypothetical protein